MWTRSSSALALAAAAVVLAPSRPALAGGAWTLQEGTLWGKLAFVYQRSDSQFADPVSSLMIACDGVLSPTDRIPYDCLTGGTFEVTALYADLEWGIVDGIDVRLQVPVILRQAFFNNSGLNASQDVALGDIRFGGQFRLLQDPFVGALRWEVKAPTGFFTTDEGIPAVGEGQWDLTAMAAVSRAFGDGWVSGEFGWRFRLPNPTTRIDVGDEFLMLLEGGYRVLPWLVVPLKVQLIYGLESQSEVEPVPRPNRWVLNALTSLIFEVPEIRPVAFEVGISVPLVGQGYPALPVISVGVWGQVDLYCVSSCPP